MLGVAVTNLQFRAISGKFLLFIHQLSLFLSLEFRGSSILLTSSLAKLELVILNDVDMKSFVTILLTAVLLVLTSCDSGFKRDGVHYQIHGDGVVVMPSRINEYIGDVVIPDTVLYHGSKYAVLMIAESAFENCKLVRSVVIPGTVKNINKKAFAHCYGLRAIHCRVNAPIEIDSTVFEGVDKQRCILYVPLQMAQSYSNSPYWNRFILFEEGEVKGAGGIPAPPTVVKGDDHGE